MKGLKSKISIILGTCLEIIKTSPITRECERAGKNKPLVSVVTPAYNAEKFIEYTLLSVKNQDYPNIEHIVIDDGSTDNTPKILKEYADKYNLIWFSKPNEGQTVTVNQGFELAKGEITIWLNADDVLFDREAVSFLVRQYELYPDVGVIYGDHVVINENNLILRVQHRVPWFTYNRLLRVYFIGFLFLRRSVIQDHKLDVNIDLPMDYEYCLRIANNGVKFKHVNRILVAYRMHGATKSISREDEMKVETRKVQERYGQKFNIRYHLLRQFDNVLFALLIIYNVRTITKLYLTPEKQDLAFPAKFDSLSNAVLRQLPGLRRIHR